jgi:hypothetical protein
VAALDSSGISEHRSAAAGRNNAPRVADRTRFRGHRGGVISMHRSMATFVLAPPDLVLSILLVLLFSSAWLIFLPWVCRCWQYFFRVATKLIGLSGDVNLREHHLTPFLRFVIPYPHIEDVGPDARMWWSTAAVVLVLFLASLLMPKKLIPVAYLLRAVLFVQASALLYFALAPGRFPHTPDSYLEGMMNYGLALISFVPVVFGLTYYIFNFGLIRKFLLTAVTMVHLSLFFPLQALLQAVILQKTVLFMPLLYIVFGLPLDVMVIIAFYSWGMSWPAKTERDL